MRNIKYIGIAVIVLAIAYVAWYSYERQAKTALVANCNPQPTITTAPDGTLTQLHRLEPCMATVIPPSLIDLAIGRMKFGGVPDRMKVNPYSLVDVLLGRYTLGPNLILPCDQSATTTDCSKLPLPLAQPQPYVPPNPPKPTSEWTSATNTPISLAAFMFTLPAGWHGSVYEGGYDGGIHVLAQKNPDTPGFTIDCPPEGKGLEAATRLSSEERSFTASAIDYSISLEQWTAPGNDPWYFLWVRTPQSGDSLNGSSGTYCLAQGNTTPDIEEAMRMMYESWK